MSWVAVAVAGAGLVGGVLGADASKSAASTQAAAANQATQVQQQEFNQIRGDLAPYMQAGVVSLSDLMRLMGSGGDVMNSTLNRMPTAADFHASPGYQWQLNQGLDAILNKQSALGGVLGGNTLKSLSTYGQGLANQDWTNFSNSFRNNQNDVFNRLFSLSGSGQNAAAGLGSIGSQTASQIGQNIIGGGNAQAAGMVGAANAASGAGNNFLLAQLLNSGGGGSLGGLFGGGFAGYSPTGGWTPGPQGFPE